MAAGAPNPFFFAGVAATSVDRRDAVREAFPPFRSVQVSTAPARLISGELDDAPQTAAAAAVGEESALRERIALKKKSRGKKEIERE